MTPENTFSYWEGPIWPHIQICIDSMSRTCGGFVLLDPDIIGEVIDVESTFHENFKRLSSPAHRADCYRAAILHKYGGFYFDCDTIGLKEPTPIAEQFPDKDCLYCVWTNPPRRILNGNLFLRKETEIGRQWLENINKVLERIPASGKIKWTALGEGSLTPAIEANKDRSQQIARDHFLPIDVDNNVKQFFSSSSSWEEFVSERTVCFGLNNSWMMYHKKDEMLFSQEERKKSDLLIHGLLSYAKEQNDHFFLN